MADLILTRRAVGIDDVPDSQVPEPARWWTYTAKYKRDFLTVYDSLDRHGRGALPPRKAVFFLR
ncbi:hypothetical protein [Cryobacterium sp. CG_9.6]|uniref:hypothetical protein n=1 Tax=Cryobacterium sp. CG_9.6 TaxID=2760710 RepID=UPI002472E848|nr:hypothetical protein [Cryobacterium sp. CG_9.6]MDH6236436.1 hypothetical protein [Cryobacterium sp. CG_9.6]